MCRSTCTRYTSVDIHCVVLCSGEDDVGFEDHVLLNHLLKGFPSRGQH